MMGFYVRIGDYRVAAAKLLSSHSRHSLNFEIARDRWRRHHELRRRFLSLASELHRHRGGRHGPTVRNDEAEVAVYGSRALACDLHGKFLSTIAADRDHRDIRAKTNRQSRNNL